MTLDSLLAFIRAGDPNVNARRALTTLRTSTGNLNSLEQLCACNAYHEVPKKAKKGQPPNLEDENAVKLRTQASDALFEVARGLNAAPTDAHLVLLFSEIPNIIPHLCQAMKCLLPVFLTEETRERSLSQLSKVLYCVSTAMDRVHIEAMIAADAPSMLISFLSEKKLAVYCLDIIYKLNLHIDGFSVLSLNLEYRMKYLEALGATVEDLVASVGSGVNDALPAKDAKGGKAAKPAKGVDPNAAAAEAEEKADHNRTLACQIKLIASVFLNMSTLDTSPLSVEEVEQVAKCLIPVVLNNGLWKICSGYEPSSKAPRVPLEDTVVVVCSLLGSISQHNDAARDAVCALNAMDALSSILIKSRAVCDVSGDGPGFIPSEFDEATENLSAKRIRIRKVSTLLSVRRVTEKAMLHILTSPSLSNEKVPEVDNLFRWKACEGMALSSAAYGESVRAVVAKLMAAVGGPDVDLSNRVVRLLSCVVQCVVPVDRNKEECDSPPDVSLSAALGLDTASVASKLSAYAADLANSLHQELLIRGERPEVEGEAIAASPREVSRVAALKREAEAMCVSQLELMYFKWEEGERRGLRRPRLREELVNLSDVESIQADESIAALLSEAENETADFLFPSLDEGLVHALSLLRASLSLSAEAVKSAATEEFIKSLVLVLYASGPTGYNNKIEHMTRLYDPKIYNWREEHDRRDEGRVGEFSMVALRGVAATVLTVIAGADAKYRKYEAEIPCAPGTPVPPSTSACFAAANLVCRLGSDVCFSILQGSSRLSFDDSGLLSCGPATNASCFFGIVSPAQSQQDVLNAFLALAAAIGSCGLVGLSNCYQSLAVADGSPHHCTALSSLKACIEDSISTGKIAGEDATELLNASVGWEFPLHFQFIAGDDAPSPLSAEEILSRRDLWPFIAASSSVIGPLSDPRSSYATVELSVSVLQNFSLLPVMESANQPAIADLFLAVFISLGGCVALVSRLSCFGGIQASDSEMMSNLVKLTVHIISRGIERQTHWDKVLEKKLEAQREAAAAAEATGGKGKKEDKKSAKDEKKQDKGKKGSPVVEEKTMCVPFEPDDCHADPNHGPSLDVWGALLNARSDCYLSRTEQTTPLAVLCQSMLAGETEGRSAVLLDALLSAAVDVNKVDGNGASPLMYALVLGNRPLVDALLVAGADTDVIDKNGVPTIVYAFLSIKTDSLNTNLSELVASERSMVWDSVGSRNNKAIRCAGTCDSLNSLLDKGVDLQVSNSSDGNYPLHFACGFAELGMTLGGVRFIIDNTDYAANFGRLNTAAIVQSLIDKGASAKSCNKAGMLSVHIAAASGDVATVELLLRSGGGELANMADAEGYLPLHYAAAACPRHSFEVINALLKWGDLRPMAVTSFQDDRTELSGEEKYWHDIETAMSEALNFGAVSDAVSNHRLSRKEIVQTRTHSGLSPLHLVLAGRALSTAPLTKLMSPWDNVATRVAVAEMFCEIGGECVLSAAHGAEETNLSPVHTLSLLGVTKRKPNAFISGTLRVCSIKASGFIPPCTEQSHDIFVKLQHGGSELQTSAMSSSRTSLEQLWAMTAVSALELSPSENSLVITVWSGEVCIGRGSVSLGTIGRGQLVVGEEIVLQTSIISETTTAVCGSVAVRVQTENDEETTGVSGPIFSSQGFFSKILKSVDNSAEMCSSLCSWSLTDCNLPSNWTPLHACIISQNRLLVMALLGIQAKSSAEWSDIPYLHFAAKNCHNMTLCGILVEAHGRLKPAALNRQYGDEYPLHAAVRCKNIALVNALVDCHRVNLNAKDAISGATAFLEACRTIKAFKDSDVLTAFERNADRIDFFIPDNSGETCIDYAIRSSAVDLVSALCSMRMNDVVERITSSQGDRVEPVLLALEKENIQLTHIVHAALFEDKARPLVAKKADEEVREEEEEEHAIDADDRFPSHTSTAPDVEVTAVLDEPDVAIEQKVAMDETIPLLSINEKMLTVLLKCVLDSSVAPAAEFHAHECYAAGQLLREHQEAAASALEVTVEVANLTIGEIDDQVQASSANGSVECENNDEEPETTLNDSAGEIVSVFQKELKSFNSHNSASTEQDVA